jgi:diaminohydroxyphosphoribosylaminopyrimidine deaminase / 5-amino-6-(5-phosphoribosylamino)uracil reductase
MPETDQQWMERALKQAEQSVGLASPNPAVGCVLVRDDRLVGEGFHEYDQRDHAEIVALKKAGPLARGAIAYVTLEPCSHHGQTGPCADALIAAGVARVVVAIGDPDSRVSGQGLARLQDAGIIVETGLLADAAAALSQGFLSRITAGRPMVTLKLAVTLDGRIATHNGDSHWITGEDARAVAHGLRASHDAVAVGNGTAATDDPHLTCRLPGLPLRPPVRVVFDSRLQLSLTSQLIATARTVPTWIVTLTETVEQLAVERADALQDLGVGLIPVSAGESGRISITEALQSLGEAGLTRMMVEGGGKLAASFLAEGLVDALALFRGPSIIGGDGIPAVAGLGLDRVADAPQFRLTDSRKLGVDVFESYTR